MTTFLEAINLISTALSSPDPSASYAELVRVGMDLSGLTYEELLLLNSRFAGNTCVLFRGMTSEQRQFIGMTMANNQILRWD